MIGLLVARCDGEHLGGGFEVVGAAHLVCG